MRDYSMELSEIAAGIITDVMGSGLTARTYYSPDKNNIIMEFTGYPLYGSVKTGKVFVQYPRSAFTVCKGNIKFNPIFQSECRYYQGALGNQFAHPHIFSDGHPCWDGSHRERAVDFIANIVETLTLVNVTKDSVEIGHCASAIVGGVGDGALIAARAQSERVLSALKCKPIVRDRRRLESYINKRWCSLITIFMRNA